MIDAASIDTNDEARDEHLRGEQFFETEAFPEIKFKSSSVTFVDNVYSVTGDFTMHGVTKGDCHGSQAGRRRPRAFWQDSRRILFEIQFGSF